jgi:hypothetical protein
MPTNIRVLGSLAVAALLAAACATDSRSTEGVSPQPTRSPTTAPSPEDRFDTIENGAQQLLDFDAPRVGGGRLRGADYVGRDVVLWFFAPW